MELRLNNRNAISPILASTMKTVSFTDHDSDMFIGISPEKPLASMAWWILREWAVVRKNN